MAVMTQHLTKWSSRVGETLLQYDTQSLKSLAQTSHKYCNKSWARNITVKSQLSKDMLAIFWDMQINYI